MSRSKKRRQKNRKNVCSSFHPALNLLFFVTVITCTVRFQHPVFLGISLCSSILLSVLYGKKSIAFYFVCFLIIPIYTGWYALFHHFGVTNIGTTWIGNHFTLEALVYGCVRAMILVNVLLWFSYMYTVMTSDKIIYLFGKIAPKISLFLAILFRTVPRIKERFHKIEEAQSGIGRGIHQGGFLVRIKNFFRLLSILLTWTLDSFGEASDSMKSRGYTLNGRTAFSIYRFDNRDRLFTIFQFFLLTIIGMGAMLDQTDILYNPEILWNPITPASYLFYTAYTILCMQPIAIELSTKIITKE